MANEFGPQGDAMQEPSLASKYFGSPLKAAWTLQKWSMISSASSGKMWHAAMTGKGFGGWSGVLGFRGIALGSHGGGNPERMFPGLSPSHFVTGLLGKDKAEAFRQFGLFGKGGLLNPKGTERWANAVGRFFGGGMLESSKFTKHARPEKWKSILGKSGWTNEHMTELEQRWGRKTFSTTKTLRELYERGVFKPSEVVTGEGFTLRGAGIGDQYAQKAAETILGKRTIERAIVKKELGKRILVRRLAKMGRIANWAFAADIAIDVGTAIGSHVVNTVGSTVDMVEQRMSNMFLKHREFGGKVGVGFYSGSSGNERQRALSAIGSGYNGNVGMGNEASYQHVDSTW